MANIPTLHNFVPQDDYNVRLCGICGYSKAQHTTKPIAESGWSELRHAINDMNNQPDISANDSPRLKEFCRVTATEIRAVGGVGAATSLEMIGYIRELERLGEQVLRWWAWAESTNQYPDDLPPMREITAALREALAQTGATS